MKNMKKLFAVLAAMVLALCIGTAALAEGEIKPFALNDEFTWNMTAEEIAAKFPNTRIETKSLQKLDYLEPDDYKYIFGDLSCEIDFALKDGKLMLIHLDFDRDRGASADKVQAALEGLYGPSAAEDSTEAVEALAAATDAKEVELYDDDPLTYTLWELEDGTRVLMVTDVRDNDADVYFASAEL